MNPKGQDSSHDHDVEGRAPAFGQPKNSMKAINPLNNIILWGERTVNGHTGSLSWIHPFQLLTVTESDQMFRLSLSVWNDDIFCSPFAERVNAAVTSAISKCVEQAVLYHNASLLVS